MKTHIKRASYLALCFLFVFTNQLSVSADESEEKSGKLRLQIERIREEEKGAGSVETELDKIFPELFAPQTGSKIEKQQEKEKARMQTLKHELFQGNAKLDKEPSALSKSIFTEDYREPRTEKETEGEEGPFSFTLMLVFTLFAVLLLAGLFWMIRKFA